MRRAQVGAAGRAPKVLLGPRTLVTSTCGCHVRRLRAFHPRATELICEEPAMSDRLRRAWAAALAIAPIAAIALVEAAMRRW